MRKRSKHIAPVFAIIAIVALSLSSCTTTPAPPATLLTAAERTKPYGSLTIAGQFGTGHLDFFGDTTTFGGLANAIIDTLAYYTPDDELVGGIAERWEISPDGKTHTFYIRRGVTFHDGSDLTGADVKFSIERMLKPGSTSTEVEQWRAVMDRVELKDDYTVLLRLKQPRFELLKGVEKAPGAVMPKKYIEEKGEEYFGKNVIGSGPWKLVKFEPGIRLELEAVESHWREVPKFQRVTLLNVKEQASRIAMLKTGELDAALVGPDSVPGLEQAGLRIIRSKPGQGTRYWIWPWFDLERPDSTPLGDVRVRKALQLAINGKELADKMFRGFGGPYAVHPMRAPAYFNDPNQIKIDPFDPEGAKKLLAEAGYANGFDTKLWDVGAGTQLSTVNQALTGYWGKIGVNSQLVPMDYNAMRSRYRPKVLPEVWGTLYSYLSQVTPGFDSFATYYHSKQSVTQNIKNPRLDELIDLVPATLDPAQKKRYATEAAVLAKNAYTVLSVVDLDALLAVSSKISEVKRVDARQEGVEAIVYETIAHAK